MGQRPNELAPHESLQHYWGAELRALRVAQGLSLAELGRQLHCDPSYLAKIERAERSIPTRLAESCDQVLATHGALVRLHALVDAVADQTAGTGDQASLHVACDEVHVAGQASSLASAASFPAALDTGAEIVVPARTADGGLSSCPSHAGLSSRALALPLWACPRCRAYSPPPRTASRPFRPLVT